LHLHELQKWRPLDGRLGQHTVVWLQAKVRDRGFGLRPRLFAGSVTTAPLRRFVRQLWRCVNEPSLH